MPRLHLAALVAVAALCAACSSTSGTTAPAADTSSAAAAPSSTAAPAGLDAAKVGQAVADAAKKASAVHVRGTITQEGTINLDLQLNQDSASGTVVKDGIEIPVLRVGDKYYFRFTDSLIKEAGVPSSAAKLLKDKWVPSTAKIGAGIGEAFKEFMDYKTFTDNTVGQLATTTFTEGQPAGVTAQTYSSSEGTATVSTTEPHYLLRIVQPKTGTIDFADWDKPAPVKEPAKADIYSGPGA
ncbi:hypothetical protein [Amycolatopsis sp. NPDC004378]